jgi:hypothetical protein
MAEAYPQEETIESREGDAVHWAGAELLRGQQVALGQVAANGVTLTDEMIDTATQYANYLFKRHGRVDDEWGGGHIDGQIEQLCGNGALHKDNWGTPDFWQYDAESHTLYVDDLKNGHRFVDEVRNWQLMNYAALIAHERGLYGDDRLRITMTIHQPRAYHRRGAHRSVTLTLGELRKDLSLLSLAFRNAMLPNAPVVAADPEQCLDCPGRVYCEAAIAAGYIAVDMAYDSTPLVMSHAAMSKEYRMLLRAETMIKARREGIKQAIESTIRRGQAVPFFGMVHSKGRRVFMDNAREQGFVDIAMVYGVTAVKEKLITPTQAIAQGVPEEIVQMYSHAPAGAAELVVDDGTDAARIFGDN